MGVMPFLATCRACELFYCMILLFLFEWRIKFSLSPGMYAPHKTEKVHLPKFSATSDVRR